MSFQNPEHHPDFSPGRFGPLTLLSVIARKLGCHQPISARRERPVLTPRFPCHVRVAACVTASFNPLLLSAPGSGSSTLTFASSPHSTTVTSEVTVNGHRWRHYRIPRPWLGTVNTAATAPTRLHRNRTPLRIVGTPGNFRQHHDFTSVINGLVCRCHCSASLRACPPVYF